MAESPTTGYGIIGGIFFLLLNFALGERKPTSEAKPEDEEPGKIAKNAIGAAFVDKSTADAITAISADVKAIRTIVEENAEREAEESLEKRLEGSIENRINRALDRLEHRDRRHPGEHD